MFQSIDDSKLISLHLKHKLLKTTLCLCMAFLYINMFNKIGNSLGIARLF